MIYKFITNNPELASYATSCGVHRIFVDMEYLGKDKRQGHLNSHKARHTIENVQAIHKAVPETELMVRINPVYEGTASEVDSVIEAGADLIMLPMFTTAEEVDTVIKRITGRCRLCLLLETPQALVRLDQILEHRDKIDEIHIGLNDLHLGLGLDFMFEVLTGGLIDFVADRILEADIRFGFGGVARIGEGAVPAEMVLGEHVRLGSEMVILSRTFHQNAKSVSELKEMVNLKDEIEKLNRCLNDYKNADQSVLDNNRQAIKKSVRSVVTIKKGVTVA